MAFIEKSSVRINPFCPFLKQAFGNSTQSFKAEWSHSILIYKFAIVNFNDRKLDSLKLFPERLKEPNGSRMHSVECSRES